MSAHKIGGWSVNLNERTGRDSDEIPITNESGGIVAVVWQTDEDFNGENDDAGMKGAASRIVACVNACEGINPEAVPLMLAALNEIVANDPFNQSSAGIIARKAIAAVQP